MTQLTVDQVRSRLAETLDRVAKHGERVALSRRGKNIAFLISAEDMALLERLEDRIDRLAAEAALARSEREGDPGIPWEHAEKELD
ncbi:MAG: type II toxin-antitoxin system prevent-host-death family antitoxin [Candidatus Sumerlaeota bacterium]|nr:type II toxin-antitoxin system prevent-host-death family antitoxin [Candidatus Sumerlaeota bacterium]